MSPLALSAFIFALTLGGIFLGSLLRQTLPKDHLSEDAQNTVRLGVGLIATIAALVLGLLIAAAKGFLRYAKHADQADHRRFDSARQNSGPIWPRGPHHPRTNA